jgi:hypothetical protein
MFRTRGIPQLIISVLLSPAVFADDVRVPDTGAEALPSESRTVEKLLVESAYAAR